MSRRDAWQVVQTARSLERPTSQYFIRNIFTDFLEMHGDKLYADDAAIIGGIGRLGGTPVTVIGQEKGVSLSEKARCNFGAAHPEGYRKSLRLMKQAEKFHRPVICIVDTQGAFCGIGAEERGMGEAIARNMLEMSRLRTPVISVLIGEGGSGGAIALAVSDKVAMLENSVYSILSPEGFASILWKDASRAPEAAQLMRMAAPEVHAMGLVDDVIPEPEGGANAGDGGTFAKVVEEYLIRTLRELAKQPIDSLMLGRYGKFRAFGQNYVAESAAVPRTDLPDVTRSRDAEAKDSAQKVSADETERIVLEPVAAAGGAKQRKTTSAKTAGKQKRKTNAQAAKKTSAAAKPKRKKK